MKIEENEAVDDSLVPDDAEWSFAGSVILEAAGASEELQLQKEVI